MAHEQDIATSQDRLNRHIAEGVVFCKSAHVHIVCYDNAVIAHIFAQPVSNNRFRQTRWMVWIDLRIHRMGHHNCICIRFRLLNEVYKYLRIFIQQSLFRHRHNTGIRM